MTATYSSARTLLVDLDGPAPEVDWESAPLWRVIAVTRSVPCWAGWIVGPGRLEDGAAFTAQVLVDARERAAELELSREFHRRLGIDAPDPPPQDVSIVVCTHRRSTYLPGLLEALGRLDPPAHEVIIVDNDPGDEDCKDLVRHHGAYYVREDRRGLNQARAAGLHMATGSVVAYTDDDCVPARTWLARVDEHFSDLTVDGVTGPGFAYALETPAQLRFELEGGFNRGLSERRFDWTTHAPCNSGVVGAGANMLFRRAALLALGEVFPAELDAGTPTQTGGDTYVMYRILEAGGRIVYDPGTYVFHRHRPDQNALSRTFRGYGTGVIATMWKLLLERREPEAMMMALWLWRQYRYALIWRFLGRADPVHLRLAADYLIGGFTGISSWYRAVAQRAEPASLASPAAPESVAMSDDDLNEISVSVVIPSVGRSAVLERCLQALPAPSEKLEIILVDDRSTCKDSWPEATPDGVRVLRSGGAGAAAARNLGARAAHGDVLVFLDDDLVAAPGLVGRHLAAHAGRARAFVVGLSLPRPLPDRWAARAAALWWHDHFRSIASRSRLSPTDLLSGNVSIRRDLFVELGGFSQRFGRERREDWLFGAAVLRAGLEVHFDQEAVAYHEYTLTTAGRLDAAAHEGRGDALLVQEDGDFQEALGRVHAPFAGRRGQILDALVARPRAMALIVALLDALEHAGLRSAWLSLFGRVQRHAYHRGRRGGVRLLGAEVLPNATASTVVLDPGSSDAPAFGGLFTPALEVVAGNQRVRVEPDMGRWTSAEALRAASLVAANGALRPALAPARTAGLRVALIAAHDCIDPEFIRACEAAALRLCACQPDSMWHQAELLAATAEVDVVWIALPGTNFGPKLTDELRELSDGAGVAVSHAVPGRAPRRVLHHRQLTYGRWLTFGVPPALVGFRPDALRRLGALDRDAEEFGTMAPGLELFERALRAGEVVSRVEVTGATRSHVPRRPWLSHEWQRQRARAALIVRRAGTGAPTTEAARAVALILGSAMRNRSARRSTVVALGGFAHGLAGALLSGWRGRTR